MLRKLLKDQGVMEQTHLGVVDPYEPQPDQQGNPRKGGLKQWQVDQIASPDEETAEGKANREDDEREANDGDGGWARRRWTP